MSGYMRKKGGLQGSVSTEMDSTVMCEGPYTHCIGNVFVKEKEERLVDRVQEQ